MDKLFDLHFHFLYKHYVSKKFSIDQDIETKGFAKILDTVFGGPFDSQCSPKQIKNSPLCGGIAAVLGVEHAYANRILHVLGMDLSPTLPLDRELFKKIRDGLTTYYDEFKNQVNFCVENGPKMEADYGIHYLKRSDWSKQSLSEIEDALSKGDKKYFAFSIEGGHNLSTAPIHKSIPSQFPEVQLQDIQDHSPLDFISLNICHLSEIPEQSLATFAQGVNKQGQIAFHSEDFMPTGTAIGISQLGKKVIRQALMHPTKPILIDIKHMSLYSRFHYYRYREALIRENPKIDNLPILCSHAGFTFTSVDSYINDKKFKASTDEKGGRLISLIQPENRKIGRTNDRINSGLYCNPWTINLFDEDIIEIMQTRGMIGIIFDQRVLGASNPALDSIRDKYFEKENVTRGEYERLFRDGQLPGAEAISLKNIAPSRPERHMMLFCLHLVYAVQLGYASLNWIEGTSPWDCICLGSDFDGLINPINGFESIDKCSNLRDQLRKYLPQADKFLLMQEGIKALHYNDDGTVNANALENILDRFLLTNGIKFLARYLRNWEN